MHRLETRAIPAPVRVIRGETIRGVAAEREHRRGKGAGSSRVVPFAIINVIAARQHEGVGVAAAEEASCVSAPRQQILEGEFPWDDTSDVGDGGEAEPMSRKKRGSRASPVAAAAAAAAGCI
ncbi:hypothetical protein K0M31_009147 [Melipona bicolor]|uniref:Uncharacterized protein n=1 Tax=Melipona bicolor TaxID=60889 RepID=A0AA40FP20_9HYME|nr:hypothetical protein K0M31_009147 [Melipona bicolor]